MKTHAFKSTLISSVLIATTFASYNVSAYDIVKRTRLIDDKWKTQEMLRPFGHDFLFDVGAQVTPDTQDLMDDVDKISGLDKNLSQTEMVNQSTALLSKYYNKENALRFGINAGFPIFSFSAFGFHWKPNFRLNGGATVVITPTEARINIVSIATNLKTLGVPSEIADALVACNLAAISNGTAILDGCEAQGAINATQKQQIINIKPSLATLTKYSNFDTNIPALNAYMKAEVKAGFPVDFTRGEHWFGTVFFGALGRADVFKSCDSLQVALDTCEIELDKMNTEIYNSIDLKVGYKNSNYSLFTAIEEVKLAELNKETESQSPLRYGFDPLIRLHGTAKYRVWIFSAEPFVGTHARSGYGMGDAYYFGADWGGHLWGDRLGVTFRTQFDKEHMTLALRMKLWLMHLEVTSKTAMKDTVDNVKVADYLGANVRFFF